MENGQSFGQIYMGTVKLSGASVVLSCSAFSSPPYFHFLILTTIRLGCKLGCVSDRREAFGRLCVQWLPEVTVRFLEGWHSEVFCWSRKGKAPTTRLIMR